MIAGNTPVLVHNCSIDRGDVVRMYIKTAKTFRLVSSKERSTLALAKVWNNDTRQIEDWAALTSPDSMSREVEGALSGYKIARKTGHAEQSIFNELDRLNDAGGNYEMMGITSSGRFCTTVNCYGMLLQRGLRMLAGVGETVAEAGYSRFRAAVNPQRYSG